jgi:hypothetical protein
MQENADQQPEGIRAQEKSVEDTIADAKSLAELNKKLAEQLRNIGSDPDKTPDPQLRTKN